MEYSYTQTAMLTSLKKNWIIPQSTDSKCLLIITYHSVMDMEKQVFLIGTSVNEVLKI